MTTDFAAWDDLARRSRERDHQRLVLLRLGIVAAFALVVLMGLVVAL